MSDWMGLRIMRLHRLFLTVLVGVSLPLGTALPEHLFELGFAGPESVSGQEGAIVTLPYACTLTSRSEELGARGWCIGLRAENASLRSITTAGTVVDELLKEDGFQHTELTVGPENDGAVSCVILSLGHPRVSLPAASMQTIARVELDLKIPGTCQTAVLRHQDGLRASPPIPIWNLVFTRSGLQRATLKELNIEVADEDRPCHEPEPGGDIPTSLWNFLLPLTNRYGCDAGGTSNMSRNWVTPFQFGREDPRPGDEWEIDFSSAVSAGWEAGNLYRQLGLSGAPVWASLAWLAELTRGVVSPPGACEPPLALDCEVLDFKAIVERLNAVGAGFQIPSVAASNVLALAQTHVENLGDEAYCVDLCLASDNALQVWVNGEVVASSSVCGGDLAACKKVGTVSLLPGLNRLSVACWQGDEAWRFRLALADPTTGKRLTNANQAQLLFVGGSPEGTNAVPGLEVLRQVENADCCPIDGPVGVVLKGNGVGSGNVDVVEALPAPTTSADIVAVSDDGIVSDVDGVTTISWSVPVETLSTVGVSYRVRVDAGTSITPSGELLDCKRIGGVAEIKGSWPRSGVLGVFDDSHDIGSAAALSSGRGSTVSEPGADGELGTADDSYSVRGAGAGPGSAGDSFHFTYKRVRGDFSATVRVAARDFPASGGRDASYGLMARLDCSPVSRFSFVHANLEADLGPDADHPRGDGVFHQFRQSHRRAARTSKVGYEFPDPDGDGPHLANQPNRFRLVRRGAVLTSYASFDGNDWKLIGSDTWYALPADAVLLVGVACARGDAAPDAGVVTFTGFDSVPPRQAEQFQNESQSLAIPTYRQKFDEVPDGEVPSDFIINCLGPCDTFRPQVFGGRLRLTEEGVAGTSVAAFLPMPVPINSGTVIVEFTLYLRHSGIVSQPPAGDPNPGQGITMTLMAGQDPSRVGTSGQGLGYEGLTRGFDASRPSLAVEADTWADTNTLFNEGTGSPRNDGAWHMGLNSGGSVHSLAINSESLPDAFAPQGVRFRVVYESQGRVTIFVVEGDSGALDGEGGGGIAIVGPQAAIDEMVEPLDSQGDATGLLAFTAATGNGTQTSEIDNVTVLILECTDSPETVTVTGPVTAQAGTLVTFDASGSSAGNGDANETLRFQWSVSGDATISGSATGPDVTLVAASGIDDGEAILRIEVSDGSCTNPVSSVATRRLFITSSSSNWASYDANRDGSLDITDPIVHLLTLFGGGGGVGCREAMDFNGDSRFDITDPIAALAFLFLSGPPPAQGDGCRFYPQCEISGSCPQ